MFRKTRLFTPGPTPLFQPRSLPWRRRIFITVHRSSARSTLKVLAQLKTFIGTSNDVVVLASSGSGAMEAAVSNLTSPGDKVAGSDRRKVR